MNRRRWGGEYAIVAFEGLYCLGLVVAILSGNVTAGVAVPLVIVAA